MDQPVQLQGPWHYQEPGSMGCPFLDEGIAIKFRVHTDLSCLKLGYLNIWYLKRWCLIITFPNSKWHLEVHCLLRSNRPEWPHACYTIWNSSWFWATGGIIWREWASSISSIHEFMQHLRSQFCYVLEKVGWIGFVWDIDVNIRKHCIHPYIYIYI